MAMPSSGHRAHPSSGLMPETHHRNIQGGAARAAMFGVSDGLVSNVSLILGFAGANAASGIVRLAGLAGLLAGAFSMAAGEYVSVRAQAELLEAELEMERVEIHRRPDHERNELAAIYRSRGVDAQVADDMAAEVMSDPQLALETHAREELGINPAQLGSPVQAGLSSFFAFALGAVLPLVPWFLAEGDAATIASVAVAGVAALVIGFTLSRFTRRSGWKSALRQLAIAAIAAGVTYGVGAAVGVTSTT